MMLKWWCSKRNSCEQKGTDGKLMPDLSIQVGIWKNLREAQLHWAKAHIIAEHIICTECNIVHLCPPCGGMMLSWRSNDVACVARKWCCVLRTQMKKSKSKDLDFLAGALGLEPRTNGFGDRDSTNWAIPLYTKTLNIYSMFSFWCTFGDSNPGPTD